MQVRKSYEESYVSSLIINAFFLKRLTGKNVGLFVLETRKIIFHEFEIQIRYDKDK